MLDPPSPSLVIQSAAKDLLLQHSVTRVLFPASFTSETLPVKNHVYFVYILASRSRTLYIGVTNSVDDRVEQHRAPHEGFTDRYRVWRLVHFERFRYVLNAIRREKVLKGWSRAKKIALIEETNPTWEDLSLQFSAPARLGFCLPQSFRESERTAGPSSGYRPSLDDKKE